MNTSCASNSYEYYIYYAIKLMLIILIKKLKNKCINIFVLSPLFSFLSPYFSFIARLFHFHSNKINNSIDNDIFLFPSYLIFLSIEFTTSRLSCSQNIANRKFVIGSRLPIVRMHKGITKSWEDSLSIDLQSLTYENSANRIGIKLESGWKLSR